MTAFTVLLCVASVLGALAVWEFIVIPVLEARHAKRWRNKDQK